MWILFVKGPKLAGNHVTFVFTDVYKTLIIIYFEDINLFTKHGIAVVG